MQLPKEIKIGNRVVKVELRSFQNDEFEGMNAMGFYDSANFRIVIDADLEKNNPTQVLETFWHELMHAIFDYTRFGVELAQEIDDKDTPEYDAFKFEERYAETFAKVFLQVIQDNDLMEATG